MSEVMKATGEAKKSSAIQKAVEEYLRERPKREILDRVIEGKTDYKASSEEIEAMAQYDDYDSY